MRDRDYSPRLRSFAKDLRNQATGAEQRIWQVLRAGRMHGWHFRRQHPMCGYILDFYCGQLRLAIELDGGQHFGTEGRRKDELRDQALAREGVKVIRFTDYHALSATDGVMESIARECRDRAERMRVSPSERYLQRE